METNSPLKSKLSEDENKPFINFAANYYKLNRTVDKRIFLETRQKLIALKEVNPDIYDSVISEDESDEDRIKNRIENIGEYFEDPEKFKKFQKKVLKTTQETKKAYRKKYKGKLDEKIIQNEINCMEIPIDRLKNVKNNEAKMYWEYMNRPHIKGTNVKEQIIGSLKDGNIDESTKNVLDYIKKSLHNISEFYMKGESPPSESPDKQTPSGESASSGLSTGAAGSVQDNTPYNKYMDYDVEKITDIIKNMSAHYDQELLNKQTELNKQCHAEIDKLREPLSRLDWGKKLLSTEKQNQNQNQNQNSPLEYLVTLDKIYKTRVSKNKRSYPLMHAPANKPRMHSTKQPPQISLNQEQADKNAVTPINAVQPAAPAVQTVGADIAPITASPQTDNTNAPAITEQTTVPVAQNITGERPAPPTTLPPNMRNTAKAPAQASPTPAKSEQENSNQAVFSNISVLENYKNFDEVKAKIIEEYCKKLLDFYDKLRDEFSREQRDAFTAMNKKKGALQLEKGESLERSKQNLQNTTESSYNFDISAEKFLYYLLYPSTLAPSLPSQPSRPPKPLAPPRIPSSRPPKPLAPPKINTKSQPTEVNGSSTAGASGNSSDAAKLNKLTEGKNPNTEKETEDAPEKAELPKIENFSDIVTGKIYQSNFLEKVADSLLPLYDCMKKYMKEETPTSEDDDVQNPEPEKDNKKEDDNNKKGKGFLSYIKNIFHKKDEEDDDDESGPDFFEESDMENLISSLYSTNDSQIYNLRQLQQKEIITEYSEKYDVSESDALKNYFSGEYVRGSSKKKKYDIGGTILNSIEERFQYTRAILRAFICIRNDVIDITSNNGATQTNVKNNLSEGIYKEFLDDLMRNKQDGIAIRTTCEKYLEKCRTACENNKDDKHNYKFLLKCIKNVLNGTKYNDSDLREALKDNAIPETEAIAQNIRKETKWLINGEGSSELNIQWKAIEESMNNKKNK